MKKMTFSILFLGMVLSGCISSGPAQTISSTGKTDFQQVGSLKDRKIKPSDLLILHVTPGKEFEKDLELQVNLNGEISVPLIGWIKVEDLTTEQAEKEIGERLDKDFLVNPKVSLRIKEAKSRAVVLLGQLKKPGTYEFPSNGRMTLLESIAKAEGFTDIANLKNIKLVRTMPNGKQMTIQVNGERILSGEEQDIPLEEGDLVTVPETLF